MIGKFGACPRCPRDVLRPPRCEATGSIDSRMALMPRRSNSGLRRAVAELGRAQRGEVARVGKEDDPGIPDPLVETNLAVSRVRCNPGRCRLASVTSKSSCPLLFPTSTAYS